jgi:hypothetical protein
MLEKSPVFVTRNVNAVSLNRWERAVAPIEKLPILKAIATPNVFSWILTELRNGKTVYSRHANGFFCRSV